LIFWCFGVSVNITGKKSLACKMQVEALMTINEFLGETCRDKIIIIRMNIRKKNK